MATLNEQLEAKINEGKIILDSGRAAELKNELLRQNSGTKITEKLQKLVLELAKLTDTHIRVSSLVRASGHHGSGRAVDIGNEEIATSLLPKVATDDKVAALNIDELIFDAGEPNRNKWNYDQGSKHIYDTATLDQHKDHIHFSVTA